MKNTVIVLLLAVSIALGAFCVHQQKQAAQNQARLAKVQTQLADAQNKLQASAEDADKIASAERKSKILSDTLVKTSEFADEKTKQADQLQQSLTAAKTNSTGNPFSAMFKDPKMREMIKAQQKAVMGPMIEKQYAALFQQLNLTPEQSANLKDLLQKKMLAGADAGMSLLDDSLDATQRADLAKQMKSDTDAFDAEIKQSLGDDGYKSFQAYEKTTPDRMAVSQFTDQLGGGATAMTADQQSQLIQAMSDERNGFKWTTDYSDQTAPADGNLAARFTDDKIAQFAKEKEQLDQQVLARAQQILTPEQVTAFEQFQTTQREMQMAGMKMAAQMFAPKSQ